MTRSISGTRRTRGGFAAAAAALALVPLLFTPGAAGAQQALGVTPEYSRFSGTVGVLNTQPLGSLATGPGIGGAVSVAWAVGPARMLRLRAEGRFAGYGSEERRECLSIGCLIQVDISTTYTTLYIGAGPELAVPVLGSELVLAATAGYANFGVSSSIRGVSDPDSENLLTTENFRDDLFAWSVGGDLRVPVASQFSIMLGAQYQRNGEASYVPEGGITQNPDGSVDIDARTTDANMVAITLGVAFRPFVGWTDQDDEGFDGF